MQEENRQCKSCNQIKSDLNSDGICMDCWLEGTEFLGSNNDVKTAHCIICGRKKEIRYFTTIEPTPQGGFGPMEDPITKKTVYPSSMGTCNLCHRGYSRGHSWR